MSTFKYLTPGEAVWAAREGAPDYRRIVGSKGISACRLPFADRDRTRAGSMRPPSQPWQAHAYLDEFREIKSVEWAKDADPGTIEVFFTDGTTDLLHAGDLLCVERPV